MRKSEKEAAPTSICHQSAYLAARIHGSIREFGNVAVGQSAGLWDEDRTDLVAAKAIVEEQRQMAVLALQLSHIVCSRIIARQIWNFLLSVGRILFPLG